MPLTDLLSHRLFLSLVLCCASACGPGTVTPDRSDLDASIDARNDVVLGDSQQTDAPVPFTMPRCDRPASTHRPLATRCQHFVDALGRVVLLHGVNARVQGLFDVTFDDGRTALEPIPEFTEEDAQRMRSMGFNLLRLPLNWSGIEPQERQPLSETYLQKLTQVLTFAQRAGLFVLLDFHQDAYSKEIGEDGAPLWAIRPAPEMLLQGPLTDLTAQA